jgi:beta-barrel assembly-enhancing protease
MKRYFIYLFLIPLFFVSCDDTSSLTNFNIFPVSDDIKLGQQLDSTIKKDTQEYPLYSNPAVDAYLEAILAQILNSPENKYKSQFNYNIQIINRDDVINAFATPGGYLYVYTGLLKFAESKAEVAAIIAHEVAHAERRHATSRMTKQYGIEMLLSIILGNNPSELEQIAANLFTSLGLLKNSRDDEYEADEYSFKYLLSTPYYAGAMTDFFTRIDKDRASNPSQFDVLLSTHPLDADRIAAVNKMIADKNLSPKSEANMFYNDYVQNVKNKL